MVLASACGINKTVRYCPTVIFGQMRVPEYFQVLWMRTSTDNESQIPHDSTLKCTMTVSLKGPKLPIRNGTAVLSQGEQHDSASESCWLLKSCQTRCNIPHNDTCWVVRQPNLWTSTSGANVKKQMQAYIKPVVCTQTHVCTYILFAWWY